MREGGCAVGAESGLSGLRETVRDGEPVGLGGNLRQRGLHPEEVNASGDKGVLALAL